MSLTLAESSRKQVLLQRLFHGVTVTALLVVLLPLALFPITPAFPGKTIGVAFFLAACLERMWAMYLRQGVQRATSGGRDWSAVAVGYAYAITLGVAIGEFLLGRQALAGWIAAVGAALYLAGVALRYWAFHILRHQWHVDVSDVGEKRRLVREGPYGLMRHPLYFGACLEIVGLPLFLGSWIALLIGALVFIPLEVARAYYEERFLRDLFGDEYRRYAAEVWAFFPLPFNPGQPFRHDPPPEAEG
jgi:protein-S-isoprenylcysteine O-methyltransferase Ste14